MKHTNAAITYMSLLLCGVTLPIAGLAHGVKTNPIDAMKDACIEANGNTMGMIDCLDNAYDSWETDAKKALEQLVSSLDQGPNGVEIRRTVELDQQSWVNFHEKESLWYGVIEALPGTMYPLVVSNYKMKDMRLRALRLWDHQSAAASVSDSRNKSGKLHPIDAFYDSCTDTNLSTTGMMECSSQAEAKWDTEMNAKYKELMGLLDPAGKTRLRNAQLEWIKYRDADFALINTLYTAGISELRILLADSRKDLVKERALRLTEYSATIAEGSAN